MRYKLAILALLAVFALAAFSLVTPFRKGPAIPVPQAIELVKVPSYMLPSEVAVANAPSRHFFFSTGIEEIDIDFIIKTGQLIDEITAIIPSSVNLTNIDRINVIALREIFRAGSVFSPWEDGVTITHGGINTTGWLAHAKSGSRFPMWLSVGIESVAGSNLSMYLPPHDTAVLDSFGDSFFAPLSWGRQASAINMAYHFTRFLIAEGYFADLIGYYMDENWAAAEVLSSAAFYSFAGRPGLTPYRLIISHGPDYAYAIAAQTHMAAYRFVLDSFNQRFESARILAYIDYMDDGILFAANWYWEWVNFDFSPMEVYIFYRPSEQNFYAEAIYPWRINIFEIGNFMPTSISHEASHLLTTLVLHDHGYIFTAFDEGLAFAIMAYHGIHDRYNHGFEYRFRRGREPVSAWRLNQMMGRNGASVVRRILDEFDIIGLFHVYAYLEHRGYINGIDLNFWSRTDEAARRYLGADHVGSFGKAASFVLYLIETYGVEAYMQVHFNLARFEIVYGVPLYERIDSWLGFLREFMDKIVYDS